ncbi:hypothetical protein [Gordonia liuliyuniae]|uniref:Secreted protein n=1 Tax=Gordonia liuliyuniae TaxID=2911517 RepID=A0ABS9IWY8_9ACTN|nr:hypothetical protein [Gordonia liuliyuniae]MCF8590092.1 hypothetical protein [Gordonia liuliyuniae]
MAVVRNSVRVGIVGAAAALAVALGAPGHATAEPETTTPSTPTAPATPTPEGETPTLSGIPGDAELAELLRALKQSGGDESAIGALSSILGSEGQIDPSGLLTSFGINPDALDSLLPTDPNATDPNVPDPNATAPSPVSGTATTPAAENAGSGNVIATLEKLTGTQMLSPAIAPFCAAPTDDNPLGIVTAPAVAVPGPWPVAEDSALANLLRGTGADNLLKLVDPNASKALQAVDDGETAYALVPPSKPDSANLQVAWFNTSTMQGGMEALKPLGDDKSAGPLLKALAAADGFHGIRMARASTGEGTVLSAVFGTTTTGGRTCYFLPALGAVTND